jgi:hypothetical protein
VKLDEKCGIIGCYVEGPHSHGTTTGGNQNVKIVIDAGPPDDRATNPLDQIKQLQDKIDNAIASAECSLRVFRRAYASQQEREAVGLVLDFILKELRGEK